MDHAVLSRQELLYLLVMSGADGDEPYERFGLSAEDADREALIQGSASLRERKLLGGSRLAPEINDRLLELVGVTVYGSKQGNRFQDPDTKEIVRFVHEDGIYLFRRETDK